MKKYDDKIGDANAQALVSILLDQDTPETTKMNVIAHLIAAKAGQDFFKTIFEEGLSFGECPKCQHKNHWIVPEDSLNKMGYVSSTKDPRVPEITDEKTCRDFREACKKKKVMV